MPTPTIQMGDSQIRAVSVPGIPTQQPAIVAVAVSDRLMRVLIDNNGAVPIRLTFGSSSLSSGTSGSDQYTLPVGGSRVFVLSPKQRLYAGAVGAVGAISVHTSDALPLQI